MPKSQLRGIRWSAVSEKGARSVRSVAPFGVVALLFAAVNLLPPDTSLSEVERVGALRVCVPHEFPPLVTRDALAPGFEIELLRAVADRLGLRLVIHENRAIGRDFNPRNWRITRAQCQAIAGGVVASPSTRSFLETTRPHLETGWAAIAMEAGADLETGKVGFYAGVTGLDRLALSQFLRSQGAEIRVVNSRQTLIEGLLSGEFTIGVTESLTARQIGTELDATVMWLPSELGRFPVSFGLWKGDLTLKRSLERSIEQLRADGAIEELADRYGIAPIAEACIVCR